MEFTGKNAKDLLAKNGFKKRDFSCRVEYGVYNRSLNVTVKNLSVDIAKVEMILKDEFQEKRTDEKGELYEGGHDFVFVSFDFDLLEEYRKNVNDLALRMFDSEGLVYFDDSVEIYNDNYKVLSIYKNGEQIMRYPCESHYDVRNCLAHNYYILGV